MKDFDYRKEVKEMREHRDHLTKKQKEAVGNLSDLKKGRGLNGARRGT